jgi:transcriptional regulator with XRE-family HTH domain
VKKLSDVDEKEKAPSTFGERLLFAIWLSAKTLGTDNSKQFARAIGKGAPQLSKWVNEKPRPEWPSIKKIADAVGIDPLWLDEPTREGAKEPDDFPAWLRARRKRLALASAVDGARARGSASA